MKVKSIEIENFDSNKDFYSSVQSWREIVNAIDKLDGNKISYCMLYKTENPDIEDFLMIGGGKDGIYVCSYYNGDEYHLVNKNNKNDQSIIQVLTGQVSGKFKRHCVERDQLLPSVKLFCETWSVYNNPDWEQV